MPNVLLKLLFVAMVTSTVSVPLKPDVVITPHNRKFKIVDLKELCPGATVKDVHDSSNPCIYQEFQCLGFKEIICNVEEPTCGAAIPKYSYPKCKADKRIFVGVGIHGRMSFIRQTVGCRCAV